MKNKKFYWIAGTVTVVALSVAGTLFAVQRRRLLDELDDYILFIQGHKGDVRSIDAIKGWNPNYYKTTMQQRLTFSTVKSIGDEIQNAISGGIKLGTDEDKIYAALNRVANLSQLSQVAEYYAQKYKESLLGALQGDLNPDEMTQVFDIVKKLK